MKIEFYDVGSVADEKFKYVVLQARHEGKWVFVRHRDRETWEIPGGHIEPGETPDQAADRELVEETGAISFKCQAVHDYSVTRNDETNYGRLYFCEIKTLGDIGEFEIAEVMLSEELPTELTYAAIQPHLFAKVKESINI